MKDPIAIIVEQAGGSGGQQAPDLPSWYYEDEAETDAICAVTPEERVAAWQARMQGRAGVIPTMRAELAGIARAKGPDGKRHRVGDLPEGPDRMDERVTVLRATPEQVAARKAADERLPTEPTPGLPAVGWTNETEG